uniref:RNase H type-1 domain-containing protein n=1 Tax=Chenopodium quinoa TaxID=63459 RepID=A0A803M914_CHEQI
MAKKVATIEAQNRKMMKLLTRLTEQQEEQEVRHVTQVTSPGTWNMCVDGSSNFRGAGLGVVLKMPQGDMMVQCICCEFKATNNEVEYEALIVGMNLAKDLGASKLQVLCDSLLVASQMNGEFAAKDSKMDIVPRPSQIHSIQVH